MSRETDRGNSTATNHPLWIDAIGTLSSRWMRLLWRERKVGNTAQIRPRLRRRWKLAERTLMCCIRSEREGLERCGRSKAERLEQCTRWKRWARWRSSTKNQWRQSWTKNNFYQNSVILSWSTSGQLSKIVKICISLWTTSTEEIFATIWATNGSSTNARPNFSWQTW